MIKKKRRKQERASGKTEKEDKDNSMQREHDTVKELKKGW